jgi:hypothetical protein
VGRRRSYALVAVAALLLANGLYAHLLVPEGMYRLDTAPVEDDREARVDALADADVLARLPADEGWTEALRAASADPDAGVDPSYRASVDSLPPGGDELLESRVRYASLDGRVYLVETTVDADLATLRAARTTPDRALASVAVTPDRLPDLHARALREGGIDGVQLWTDRGGRIVRTDDRYTLVTVEQLRPYEGRLDLLLLLLYPAGYVVLLWGLVSHPKLPSNYRIAPAGPAGPR